VTRWRCAAGLWPLMMKGDDPRVIGSGSALARRRAVLCDHCAEERSRMHHAAQVWSEAARPSALLRQGGRALLETATRRPLLAVSAASLLFGAMLAWRRLHGPRLTGALTTLTTVVRWGWALTRIGAGRPRG
jgi:hypothetical protein